MVSRTVIAMVSSTVKAMVIWNVLAMMSFTKLAISWIVIVVVSFTVIHMVRITECARKEEGRIYKKSSLKNHQAWRVTEKSLKSHRKVTEKSLNP